MKRLTFVPHIVLAVCACGAWSTAAAQAPNSSRKGSDRWQEFKPQGKFLERLGEVLRGDQPHPQQEHQQPPAAHTNSPRAYNTSTAALQNPNVPVRHEWAGVALDNTRGGNGVAVVGSNPSGPAYRGGLRNGDRIVAVQGTRIRTLNEWVAIESQLSGRIQLTIVRGSRTGGIIVDLPASAALSSMSQYDPVAAPQIGQSDAPSANQPPASAGPSNEFLKAYEQQIQQLNDIITEQQKIIAELERELTQLQAHLAKQPDSSLRSSAPPTLSDGPALAPPRK
jgi:hypothetical protein